MVSVIVVNLGAVICGLVSDAWIRKTRMLLCGTFLIWIGYAFASPYMYIVKSQLHGFYKRSEHENLKDLLKHFDDKPRNPNPGYQIARVCHIIELVLWGKLLWGTKHVSRQFIDILIQL